MNTTQMKNKLGFRGIRDKRREKREIEGERRGEERR